MYGNRGCLHDGDKVVRRPYAGRRWISCRLTFRGWRRTPLMQPGRFTELFFLDDATAFAAGHRPCALCRRDDYRHFRQRWRTVHPDDLSAEAIDLSLHIERWDAWQRRQRRCWLRIDGLPDGVFLIHRQEPWLVLGDRLLRWSPAGYTDAVARWSYGVVEVATPPSLVAVLRGGPMFRSFILRRLPPEAETPH